MKYNLNEIIKNILPKYFLDASKIQSSEANYASLLYHHLACYGFQTTQLCTEMYSANLVKEGTRPDLVIFEEGINGRFNYYNNCDKKQPNTNAKIEHLKCVFEIKGGSQQHESGLAKYFSDDPLCLALRNDQVKRSKTQNCRLAIDVEKLGMWSSHFGEDKDYVFLAIDMNSPKGVWPNDIRDTFGKYCAQHRTHLIYYALGQKHFWHYPMLPDGQMIEVK